MRTRARSGLAAGLSAGLSVALVGCSFPTKPGPPFGCVGEQLPTTAPDTVQIRGRVFDPVGGMPARRATETGFVVQPSGPAQTFAVNTDDDGAFTANQETGGAPHPLFILSRLAGYVDTYAYPALPVADDLSVALEQFTEVGVGNLICSGCPALGAAICGKCPTPDLPPNLLIASVVNCNDHAVEGATLTIPDHSNYTLIYFVGSALDPQATATDDKTGAAVVIGLGGGTATIHATLGTTPYRDNTVTITPGAMTFAEVSP